MNVTIDDVVQAWDPAEGREVLVERLVAREDAIAQSLREWGRNLGAMPEFVAWAFVAHGLGAPVDEATRQFVHDQFHRTMHRLQVDHPELFGDGPSTASGL